MQELRAFPLAHRDGCARFLSLEVARSRGQSLVRGWNEPDKTLPYSDFRQCSAQETGVTGLKAGAGSYRFYSKFFEYSIFTERNT